MSEQEYEVGRFYTAARKFQQLIGVFPDGTVIWGGPYTQMQVLVALATLVIMGTTRALNLWGIFILFDIILCPLVAAGVGWLAGKVPSSRRSVIKMSVGVFELSIRPVEGKYRGKPLSKNYRRRAKVQKAIHVEQALPMEATLAQNEAPESGLGKLKKQRATAKPAQA